MAFAGVLILVQLGLLLVMFGTVTLLIDRASAQIWITSPETASFEQALDIPERVAALVRVHPQVARTDTLLLHNADWRSGTHARVGVSLVGLSPEEKSMVCRASIRATPRTRLTESMALLVDRGDLDKLGASVGEVSEVNGHRVRRAMPRRSSTEERC